MGWNIDLYTYQNGGGSMKKWNKVDVINYEGKNILGKVRLCGQKQR